jgi:2-polyprenyl-3-methyl-5-hydroxy-6-metoxy-1,4-benzoquinol methylase
MEETIDIDYSRHYSNWHKDTQEHIESTRKFYESKILPYFPPDKSVAILDIGCGMGFLLNALSYAGYKNIFGIDVDESQVKSCQQKGLNVSLVKDTVAYLKENSGRFDVIAAFDVLEHIPPQAQILFIHAVHSALKVGGVFIASVPNATSVLASRNRYLDYTHYVMFTEVSLDFVLYNAGFRKITIHPMEYVRFSFTVTSLIHFLLLKFFRTMRRLEMMAELGTTWGKKVPLSFNLISVAEKTSTE